MWERWNQSYKLLKTMAHEIKNSFFQIWEHERTPISRRSCLFDKILTLLCLNKEKISISYHYPSLLVLFSLPIVGNRNLQIILRLTTRCRGIFKLFFFHLRDEVKMKENSFYLSSQLFDYIYSPVKFDEGLSYLHLFLVAVTVTVNCWICIVQLCVHNYLINNQALMICCALTCMKVSLTTYSLSLKENEKVLPKSGEMGVYGNCLHPVYVTDLCSACKCHESKTLFSLL